MSDLPSCTSECTVVNSDVKDNFGSESQTCVDVNEIGCDETVSSVDKSLSTKICKLSSKISKNIGEIGVENNFSKNCTDSDDDSLSSEHNKVRKRKLMDGLYHKSVQRDSSETKSFSEHNSIFLLDSKVGSRVKNSGDSVSVNEKALNITDCVQNVISGKKRGRKKKSSEIPEATETIGEKGNSSLCESSIKMSKNVDRVNLIKNITSEPIGNETLHMSCDEIDVSSELIKRAPVVSRGRRGRGRPRKVIDSREDNKKLGRSSLTDGCIPNFTKLTGNEQNMEKTYKDEMKSVSSSSSSENPTGVVKRGRGRPRKTDLNRSVPFIVNSVSLSEKRSSERHSHPFVRHSTHHLGTKRRIIKPKRFDSYESFDCSDANDHNTISSNNTSTEDRDEDSDALQIDEGMADDDDGNHKDGGGDAELKPRKPRVPKKRKKLILRSSITCGVCNEKMTEKEYEKKHIDKHNFFCWLEGEKPLDPNNEHDYITVYCKLRKLRKNNFTGMKCPKCGVRKKSGIGYFSHIHQCGMSQVEREAIKLPCGICGRVMLPSSLKVHLGQEHKNPETKVVQPPEEEVVPLTKRQAAKRAESKLEEVLADELKQEENHYSKKYMELKRFYRQTQSRLFPSAYLRWRIELNEKKVAKCFIPGCSFTAGDVNSLRVHFNLCPHAVRVFVCKICGLKIKTEFDMHKHILSEHKDCRTGDSDFKMNVTSDNDDEVEDVTDGPGANTPGGTRIVQDKPNFVVQAMRKKGLSFFNDMVDKNYKRYLEFSSSEPIFEEFIAPLDEVVSEKDAEKFLPRTSESMNFSSECSNWKKLKCFESCNFSGTKLMFVGGPVWALSWCPLPLEETRQYFAVACHPDMNMIHCLDIPHAYNSLIQIWDCGELDNMRGMEDESLPNLKFGIAHSHGAVWSLEWCPSQCFQPSDGRLGLLAAGFSDGKAAVYSISSRPIESRLPILKSNPVLELDLISEEPAQCTKLAWSKMPPFDLVACGYSDGLIAVYNLTSHSPLLRFGKKLYPFLMFQAHVRNITGLHFLPKEGNNYILTASAERDIKFWNLQDTSGPVSISQLYRMINVTDIVWFNHWLCAASTYDDALGYGLINVALNGYRDFMFGQPYPVMSQNCLNWSISANDWTNAVATSSDGGEVTLMYSKQLFCLDEKSNKRTKKFLTTTDLFKLDGDENIDPSTKLKIPQSYEEASELYGLVLKTQNYDEYPSSRRNEVERNFYQIKSINKVAWNTNGRSFLYLAAGYHAGFIQIFRDNNLEYAKSVYENFYQKLKTDNNDV